MHFRPYTFIVLDDTGKRILKFEGTAEEAIEKIREMLIGKRPRRRSNYKNYTNYVVK